MKIREVSSVMAFGGRQSWVFVLVETDAGITGVGEASLEGKEKAVVSAVEDLARFLIGRDPTWIEQNWQIMYRHGFWRGGVVLNTAISGIEQALWDISGKELGVPVWRLLGGAARERVPLYTHCGGATIDELAENARDRVEQGWRGLKTGSLGFEGFVSEKQCAEALAERIRVMREAVGPDVLLMIDAHGRHTPGQAIRMIRLVVPYMRKRGGGSIVNIASISGWLPQLAKGSQYGAAKNSLIFLAEPLALELVHDNIRVNTLSPGSMISPDGIWEKWRQKNPGAFEVYRRESFPMGHLGSPEEVADVVVFLASPRAYWINGRHLPVDGLQQPIPAPGYKSW